MQFGVSTQLYHGERLGRAHLEEMATLGVGAIEVVATQTHVDYHDPAALDALAAWLRDTGLRLHSIHAPVTDAVSGRRWGRAFSNASPDNGVREHAVAETLAALELARRVPVTTLVVHLGVPDSLLRGADRNDRDAAKRSVEEISDAASALGVRVALENIPSDLAAPESLAAIVEELGRPDVGTCLDFGHAHLGSGVVDAVEAMAEWLVATHVHDNHGRADEHLPPFDGTIAWEAALVALRKVGYDGIFMMEVAPGDGSTAAALERIRQVCARLDRAERDGS